MVVWERRRAGGGGAAEDDLLLLQQLSLQLCDLLLLLHQLLLLLPKLDLREVVRRVLRCPDCEQHNGPITSGGMHSYDDVPICMNKLRVSGKLRVRE